MMKTITNVRDVWTLWCIKTFELVTQQRQRAEHLLNAIIDYQYSLYKAYNK